MRRSECADVVPIELVRDAEFDTLGFLIDPQPVWRVAVEPGKAGPYGFPGSPAVGEKLVYFAGLDGKVCAFNR